MFLLSFVIDESYDGGITEVHVVSSPYKSLSHLTKENSHFKNRRF
jgi:hypothetical protein